MNNHVWINPERFQSLQKTEEVDGMHLVVELSPYETPKFVEGSYDQTSGEFRIKFRYIDDEPPVIAMQDFKGVTFREGKFTGKLLSISIPVDMPPHDSTCIIGLRTKVYEGLDDRLKGMGQAVGKRLNSQAVRSVIGDSMEQLVPQ